MTSSRLRAVADRRLCRGVSRVFVVILFALSMASPVFAQGLRSAMDELVRGTARVTDDIPINKVDDVIAELSKSRAAREAIDVELRKSGRLADADIVAHGAARSDEVLRLLTSMTLGLDPSVIRRIEQMEDSSRDVAVVLAKGGKEILTTLPDLVTRGRLLREGGAETVAAVGMFGPNAARAALRLDEAIRGGTLIVKDGSRVVTVAEFGNVMTRLGNASWTFWKDYVQPHWKLWATSGALAAYLTNPEYFQDKAGKLTETGFKHLTEFVGKAAASTIRGVGQGAGTATEEVGTAIWDTFFNGLRGVYAAIGTVLFVICVSLLFRRPRYWLLWPFRWLNRSPTAQESP